MDTTSPAAGAQHARGAAADPAPRPPSYRPSLAGRDPRGALAPDLILLHAPAVFDFRDVRPLATPFADVVPSTGQFEMYPVGLTSLAAYLERNRYNVRIVNLAYRMLRSDRYDPEVHLRRLRAPIFGIDLHWLPHVHGALAVAELVKRLHPDAAVLLGGLSASYFHRELLELPYVDYVLRGDSTEEPARQLLAALRRGTPLTEVENLAFRDDRGATIVNPLSFVPADLDDIDVPAYDYVMRSVLKYRDLRDVVPYLEWLRHPTTMVLNARGCPLDCAVCGGSRSAYRRVVGRARPAYRSPERLVDDVRTIAGFSRSPIFMVHDPRVGGERRAARLFELLGELRPANELVFELFRPAGDAFFDVLDRALPAWSLQITLETADEDLRRRNGKFAYPNAALVDTLTSALDHGCRRLDLFFMVGLPGQTLASALDTVAAYERLTAELAHDERLHAYVAPLAPFLDPGSRAYEDPSLGYRRRFDRLEDYRSALLEPTWADTLSYETDAMTRDDIVRATYQVALGLNELRHRRGRIDEASYRSADLHLRAAAELARPSGAPIDLDATALRRPPAASGVTSLCGTDEMRWSGPDGLRLTRASIGRLLNGALELPRTVLARTRGRYDTAVWRPSSAAVALRTDRSVTSENPTARPAAAGQAVATGSSSATPTVTDRAAD